MEILKSSDRRNVQRLSSIAQHRDKFSVYAQGGWLPISYDVLDVITCEGARTHRAILSLNPHDIGYKFPIASCKKQYKTILLSDKYGLVTEELPEWQGSGRYQKFVNHYMSVDGDNKPLGTTNEVRYRIGLDYYLAEETIEGTD